MYHIQYVSLHHPLYNKMAPVTHKLQKLAYTQGMLEVK